MRPQGLRGTNSYIRQVGAQSKSSSGFMKLNTAVVPSRQVLQWQKLLKFRLNSLNAPPGSEMNELFYSAGGGAIKVFKRISEN
jgi:hypothetical protein